MAETSEKSLNDSPAERLIQSPTQNLADEFVTSIQGEDGTFIAQEDTLFDYKLEFPFSMSDGYFAAVVRLIISLYNSFGGVVVLGVDDKSRSGGHNRKIINIERLNTRLRELTGASINVTSFTVNTESDSRVDLLVIPKRRPNVPPLSLIQDLDRYESGTIWIRRGHEVLEAQSKDIGFLFSPRNSMSGSDSSSIQGSIPPSSAMIKSFVGRVEVLSQLLNWVSQEDEPRKFLYGRGGSGKSTVAHEFSKIIQKHADYIRLYEGTNFDRVIYLSAKEKSLTPESGRIEGSRITDFSNYDELLAEIIHTADYSSNYDAHQMDRNEKINVIKEIFDHENILFVIDDIDTLTTKGLDAGFDELFRLSVKAKQCVRLLYTQRNAPASSENSIRVPGFERESEYLEFVQNCCTLFGVPMPEPAYLLGDLRNDTEGIPLILETIIGLRKVCGNYQSAHHLFLERRGEEARRYLFEREYDALPNDNNARHVLAAIAEFERPVGNDEIGSIVQIGESAISDCVGQLIGFFLSTDISSAGETKYFVNPITQKFVRDKIPSIRFGPNIIERVRAFKSGMQKKPKEILILESDINRHRARGELRLAKSRVEQAFSPRVSENPEFRLLKAIVYAEQSPPEVTHARENFEYCLQMGFENVEGMRKWIQMERVVGDSIDRQVRICDLVINGKSYASTVRHEFISRRAVCKFFMARERGYSDAFELLASSLADHAKAYAFLLSEGSDTVINFSNTRNTAFSLVQCARKIDYDIQLAKVFRQVHSAHGFFLDALLDPLYECCEYFASSSDRDATKRRVSLLRQMKSDFSSGKLQFSNASVTEAFGTRLGKLVV